MTSPHNITTDIQRQIGRLEDLVTDWFNITEDWASDWTPTAGSAGALGLTAAWGGPQLVINGASVAAVTADGTGEASIIALDQAPPPFHSITPGTVLVVRGTYETAAQSSAIVAVGLVGADHTTDDGLAVGHCRDANKGANVMNVSADNPTAVSGTNTGFLGIITTAIDQLMSATVAPTANGATTDPQKSRGGDGSATTAPRLVIVLGTLNSTQNTGNLVLTSLQVGLLKKEDLHA